MKQEEITQKLLEADLITNEQSDTIKEYRSRGIFSLHNELLFLLYLSVLLFTTGVGTLIYKNIDTIGHSIILGIVFVITAVCFYFSFKKSKGFSKEDVDFENPVYNYLVLTATILSCVFIGYLQFQYQIFGTDYSLVTLFSAVISFGSAYYFNNKSTLSIAITSLAATIGITITPKALLENDMYNSPMLSYYGLALGILLVVWCYYSEKINLKKHFSFVFFTFALHLISICCIVELFESYWPIFVLIMIASTYYFYKISDETDAVSIFIFTLVYGYIGFNIVLYKLLDVINLDFFGEFIILITPIYIIASIFLFIRLIKQFNIKH